MRRSSEFSVRFSFLSSEVFAYRVKLIIELFRVCAANLAYFIHDWVIDHR